MRKIILSPLITLDGVMQAPGGEPGFKYTGWSGEYFNEEYLEYNLNGTLNAGALLLGRITYEGFAEAWPGREDEMGFADKMNSMQKFVVSDTLEKLEWNNSFLIKGNIVKEIKKLKNQEGNDILVVGSITLSQFLINNDLIDEYRFMVHPTILGTGERLYQNILEKKNLKLLETKVFSTGIVVLIYESVRI